MSQSNSKLEKPALDGDESINDLSDDAVIVSSVSRISNVSFSDLQAVAHQTRNRRLATAALLVLDDAERPSVTVTSDFNS